MAIARCRSSGGKTAVISDSVAGITNAAPAPCTARPTMTSSAESARPLIERAEGEHAEADEQRALAAEAVAEGAGGEQQPGEHQGVGVDDPLQHRGAGVELGLQRRQRHVERRHRHHDHDQREAQHAEEEPAALVDFGPGVEREIGHRRTPLIAFPGHAGRCWTGTDSNET